MLKFLKMLSGRTPLLHQSWYRCSLWCSANAFSETSQNPRFQEYYGVLRKLLTEPLRPTNGYSSRYQEKEMGMANRKEVQSRLALAVGLILSMFAALTQSATAQDFIPDGYIQDGFDYPIATRGYDGDNHPVTIFEHVPQADPQEFNDLYPDYNPPDPYEPPNRSRNDRIDNEWYVRNDVGNYVSDKNGLHPGEDWNFGDTGSADIGMPVYAVANGRVERIISVGSLGYLVALKHFMSNSQDQDNRYNDIMYSLYLHVAPSCIADDVDANGTGTIHSGFDIRVGDWVRRGQQIAVIADIGVNGPHLHFEIRNGNAFDYTSGTWPTDNGDGYYGNDTNGMDQDEVDSAMVDLQADGIIDPSDYIDGADISERDRRPAVADVILNGGFNIYGGTLTNPEIFVRVFLLGDPNRFFRTGISHENFKISKIDDDGNYFELEDPEAGDPYFTIVAGSHESHNDNEYSFRLQVRAEAIASLEQGQMYSLGFDIISTDSNSNTVTARAFGKQSLYFLDASYFGDIDDLDNPGENCRRNSERDEQWFACYVHQGVSYGLFKGNGNNFSPGRELSRSEMAASVSNLMFNISKLSDDGFNVNTRPYILAGGAEADIYFRDVPPCHPYFLYIQTLRNEAIVEGFRDADGELLNEFSPDAPVSRAELSKFLLSALDILPDQTAMNLFSDVRDTDWFRDHIATITSIEIYDGEMLVSGYATEPRSFLPDQTVNRGEMAKFITNAYEYARQVASARSKTSIVESVGNVYEQAMDPNNFHGPAPVILPGGNRQTLNGNSSVELSGEAYDLDEDEIFYFWTVSGGSITSADTRNFTDVTWTAPSVSDDTTFFLTAVAGDRRGLITRNNFEFFVPGDGSPRIPPSITITRPESSGEIAISDYAVRWSADDPDSNATISLYYDTDNTGLNGAPISGAQSLSEDNDLDQYTWDTSSITPGTYYIYAKIDDNVNPPQYSYSPGTVKVESSFNQPPDPHNWRLVEYVPGMNYQGIGYAAETYVAVGKRAAISLSGNEGLSWGHFGATNITEDMDFYDAHYNSGRWILVGEDNIGGIIIHSDHVDPNGSTYGWVIPTQWYGESVRDIHYADGKWVAVGHSNLVMYSTDNGNTWNQGSIIASAYNFKFQAVTYDAANDTWIAVSESSTNRSQIATSSDGITWYQRDFFNTTYRLQGVASQGGQAVAVGYKTTSGDKEVILTSANGGLTWSDASAGTQALFDVVYRPDGWVAVGNESIATSINGVTWQREPSNLPHSMNAVVYAADENNLVAVLHSKIYRARTVGSSKHHLIEIQVFGSGTVDGAGHNNCSDYCINSYPEGSVLSLTAEPTPGWLLEEWGGSCSTTSGHQCPLILTQNESIDVHFELDDAPTLDLIEPDGTLDKAHQTYTISWTDEDPDSSANILFYHDVNNDGIGGTLITQGAILEDDESDRYFWDTSSLPEGNYYVYAVINDGTSPPVTSVSDGPITIIHNDPPRLTLVEPNGIGDTEDLSYTIRWTDQDDDNSASINLFYDTNDSGADGTSIPGAQNLSEDDETDQFVWDITGLPEQDFYVYATISDGVMDPYTVYSPGPLTVLHVSTNIPPTLNFVEPDGVSDTADQTYNITWTDEDPDNNAGILFFYDDDNVGANGSPINPIAISEDDEIDLLNWDISALADGDYYVYAIINDQVRPPVTVYSPGPVTVSHANAVPSLTLHEPDGVNDQGDQTYTITWTDEDSDDDANISLFFDVDNNGANGTLIVDNLSEDDETDSYTWNTAGLNGGDYHVYASIDDGSHTPQVVYSPGQVSVDHQAYGVAWARQAGSTSRDWAYDVATDSGGNSYVTGYLRGDIQFGSITLTQLDAREAFLVKYSPTGEALWAHNFGSEDDSYGMGVAVDAANNVYVAGYFENIMQFGGTTLTATGSTDVFVTKYSSSGNLVWAKKFGTSGWSEALAVAASGSGDVYLTGSFNNQIAFGGTTLSAVGNNDIFVAKLNTNGQAQWARRAGSSSGSDNEEGYGIDVDASGNVYVTGQFILTATFGGLSVTGVEYNPDIFVVKYNSSGTAQWVRSAGGTGYDRGAAIAVGSDGYVYVTGYVDRDAVFSGIPVTTGGRPKAFLARYSTSSGNISWVEQGHGSADNRGQAIAVTSTNRIVWGGYFHTSVQFADVTIQGAGGFLVQHAPDGTLDWARPAPIGSGRVYGIALDDSDPIAVGYLAGASSFDRTDFTSMGDSDVFVVKIDSSTTSNSAPTIDLLEPDGADDIVAENFTITWTDGDPDDDAQILLYYDLNASGEDGTLLTPMALSENDETDQYLWDVSGVTPGDYYIYARIQDGSNPAVVAYSDGPLTVDPAGGNTAPILSLLEPDGVGDLVSMSLTIRWSDEDPDSAATVDLYYDDDMTPGNSTLIVGGLSEDDETDSFVWNTSGVADGEYYVYGVIDDGIAPPVVAYSSGVARIDSTPPRITGTGSVQDTGDGQLTEGEITAVNLWQLRVTFDEGMWNPSGHSEPGDITNPSNYRLSVDLGDGFDPAGCAGSSPDDVPVAVSYTAATRTATLSLQGGGLADGVYRWWVCGTLLDEAGNPLDGNADGAGADDFARTFTVDSTPPRVLSVESDPDTGDGDVGQDEITQLALTELRVRFSERVVDPPGDGSADDVTNPANYLLFRDGGSGFQTIDCASGVDAGDIGVAVDAVTYDVGQHVATLSINGGTPLGEDSYRLLVCGTTSIIDPAGSALDGDGDGVGGDDFPRAFVIDPTAPSAPSDLASSSHPVGVPVDDATIDMTWTAATDATSGLAGYASAFNTSAGWACDQSQNLVASATAVSSPALADGTWYFHLCAGDAAGNWSQVATAGPFVVERRHELSITTDGSGDGSVNILPGNTTCAGTCTETFPEDTDVTLTPAPVAGSVFTGWSGDCAGTDACVLTMDADKTVGAIFELCSHTLSQANVLAPRSGLQTSFDVTVPTGCPWTATSMAPFVTVTSGASGDGNGTISFDVTSNIDGLHRLGAIKIVGKTFMVYQAGIQIAAGGNHSLFLQDDGTALSWGRNTRGQLGDGTTTQRSHPLPILEASNQPLTGIASLDTQLGYNLLLTESGQVLANGLNTYGQAGDASFANRLFPGLVLDNQGQPLSGVVDVAAGEHHSLALLADGSVMAWGLNGGRLGDGTTVGRAYAAPVLHEDGSPISEAVAIVAGHAHSHAVLADGTVVAWGLNGVGQLGDGTTVSPRTRAEPVSLAIGHVTEGILPFESSRGFSLARRADSTLVGWGSNYFSRLGDGTTTDRSLPEAVQYTDGSSILDILDLGGGYYHSVGLRQGGSLLTWGRNHKGQLGDGTMTDRRRAVQVVDDSDVAIDNVVRVSAGAYHNLALLEDGTLLAWGYNGYGQLGDGTKTDRRHPVIANGEGVQLALTLTGTPDPVDAASIVTLSADVLNLGRRNATAVTVDITTDGTIQSASGAGWSCTTGAMSPWGDRGGETMSTLCTAASLSLGPAPTITVDVLAPGESGTIQHAATVSASEPDPRPDDNTSTASTVVRASADVWPEILMSGVATLGLPFEAALTVHNSGPSTATNVTLNLGGTLDILSATVVDLDPLAAGASATVNVNVVSNALGTATLEATAVAAETDPVANNTATASILVNKDGLSGYWPFDETDGDVAVDATGRGNDGTIYGAVRTAGVHGGALDFTGDSNRVRLPGDMSGYVEDHFTVSLWMKVTSVKSINYLFHDNDDRPGIRLNGENRPIFSHRPNGTVDPFPIVTDDDRTPLPVDEWLHVAVRWDGTVYSGYVDGHRVFSVELPFFQLGSRLFVGSDGGAVRSFDGLIDEVRIHNRALGDREIQALATDLVGHWKLDEASGDVALDSSGLGNHGLLINDSGDVWQRTEGAVGDGVDLRATNYVAIPDDGSLSIPGAMTVEAWVRVRTSPARFVHKTASFSNNEDNYTLGTNTSGNFLFHIEDSNGGSDSSVVSTTVAQGDTWHHVAGVYDGQDLLLYVDGVLEDTRSLGPVVPYTGPANLILGTTQFSTHGNRYWTDGLMDDVRIYRRSLSAEEIARHAEATVGWWRFEEAEGTRALDSSGNFHDGELSTVSGTPWQRVAGVVGQGLDFTDGENQVRIPDDGSFSLTRPFTVESWIKARQPFARAIVKTAEEGANKDNYTLGTGETGLHLLHVERSSDGEDLGAWSTTASCVSRFHHVAGTFDGEALHVYVDGVLEGTTTAGPFVPYTGSYDLLLGTNVHPGRNNPHWTDGVLDEVAVHARPLSAARIAERAAAGPVYPVPSGEITSPTGAVEGNVTVSAMASDVDGLGEVYITFVDGGTPLVLCGVSGAPPCGGDSDAWSVSDIDPRDHGVAGAGTLTLRLFVNDGCGNLVEVASANISWVDNSPPTLDPVGGPFIVNVNELLTFTASASDPNSDNLAFSLENAPAGASIHPITGVFTWTPTNAQGPQTYTFDVLVTDDDPSNPLSDSETIQISVLNPDTDPPTITRVDTVNGTGDGQLSACESARVSVSEVLLTFNEVLQDPAGDLDPDDVTNPENYLLLAAGADQDFDTDLCGTLFGDDEPIALDAVIWNEASRTATLALADAPLVDSLYRLIACGSTSLYDLAGNPLDGNGDGIGGDDFRMDFRVDMDNVFGNGHLDCGMESWIATSTNSEEIAYSVEDVDGSSLSGSLYLSNLTTSTDFKVSQCVSLEGGTLHGLNAKFRFTAASEVMGSLKGTCEYFDQTACIGPSLGMHQEELQLTDVTGQWISLESLWTAPNGSTTAMCTYGLNVPGGESFDAYLDDLILRDRSHIFSDGFESGDPSAWK